MESSIRNIDDSNLRRAAALAVAVFSLALYANALWNGFVWDDASQIIANWWIRDFGNFTEPFLSNAWGFIGWTKGLIYYRPLVHVLYMGIYKISGTEPWGYHLAGMLLNAGASAAVFFIFCRFFQSRSHADGNNRIGVYAALAGALFFAAHPAHSEAVAFASAVADPLFTLLGLLSVYFYTGRNGNLNMALSAVFFALALFSKEAAVVILPVVVAYDIFVEGKARWRRYVCFGVVLAAYLAVRGHAVGWGFSAAGTAISGWYGVSLSAAVLAAKYIYKLVLPVDLKAFYAFSPVSSVFEWRSVFAVCTLVFCAVFAVTLRGIWGLAVAWTVISAAPVLYAPSLGESVFAERYMYFPSVGFALFLALTFKTCMERRFFGRRTTVAAAIFFAAIMTFYSVSTVIRNGVWRSDLTLWKDAVIKEPGAATVHYGMGDACAKAGILQEAEKQYLEALRLNPAYVKAYNNIGLLYAGQGRFKEAEAAFFEAVRLSPGFAEAYNNLGNLYASRGMTADAALQYVAAVEAAPALPMPHYNLGRLYLEAGDIKRAIDEFEKAAANMKGGYAPVREGLVEAYIRAGMTDKAEAERARLANALRREGR